MRHRRKGTTTFGRRKDARKALMNSLVIALLENDRIETTLTRAKEVSRRAEKLITYGKKNTVHTRRQAYKILKNRDLVKKLFDEIASRYQDRNGGYTRVIKTGFRIGDAAPTAIVEFVEEEISPKKKKKSKTDKTKATKKKSPPAEKKKEKKPEVKEEKETPKKEKVEEVVAEDEIPEEIKEEPVPEEVVEQVQKEEETPENVEPEEESRKEDLEQAEEEVETAVEETSENEDEEKDTEVPTEDEEVKSKEHVDKE